MKIIVAEDDPDIREDTAERLEMSGHSVHAVSSGAELLEKLKREEYELVVTDNNMETSDSGLTVLQHIRTHKYPSLPVIMYSSDTFARAQAEELGAIFIHKFHEGPRALMNAVEKLS